MKRIPAILLTLLLACALVFTGCSAKGVTDEAYDYEVPNAQAAETYVMEEAVLDLDRYAASGGLKGDATYTADATLTENRKLITTVYLTVETEHFTELMQRVEAEVSTLGGYIEEMESNTPTSGKHRNAAMTIRIPADRLEDFTQQVEENANIIWRSQDQRDITTTYVDTQARRDALKVEQERLLELLGQAANLAEILEIEDRLTDVRYELESIESTLRTYDNQVSYATVHLDVTEVEVLTVVEEEEPGFWEKIGDGFVNSAKGVWNGVKSIFSAIVIALPWLLVILLPPAIVLIIIFSVKKRKYRK
ncbi:MAG: DUF4349 domain-containing protein [Oscillospiraceae bacterium]|nr:DUF4349 domain-containing protein [Oscillospiraceae bacterium]